MFYQLLFILWFFLPAGIANMTPVFAAKLPLLHNLSYPLDGYKKFRRARVLGDHKTVRGLMVGTVCSIVAVLIQQYWYGHSEWIQSFVFIDYTTINPLLLGLLFGIGALGGDAVKSFLKRQVSIKPGESWFPFDQLDYILGAILLTYWYIPLPLFDYILALILWFILHVGTTILGAALKLKKDPI